MRKHFNTFFNFSLLLTNQLVHSISFLLTYLFFFLIYLFYIFFGLKVAVIAKVSLLVVLFFSLLHGFYGLVCVVEDYTFNKSCSTLFSNICLLLLLKFVLFL